MVGRPQTHAIFRMIRLLHLPIDATLLDALRRKCYEVKCRNADIPDGYGNTLSRSRACYDESKSVVITIVDACPCRVSNPCEGDEVPAFAASWAVVMWHRKANASGPL